MINKHEYSKPAFSLWLDSWRWRWREREREDSEQHTKVLSISWPGDCGVFHVSCLARVPGWQLEGGAFGRFAQFFFLGRIGRGLGSKSDNGVNMQLVRAP